MLAAGNIIVNAGLITWFSDQSGHYRPTPDMTAEFFRYLSFKGVDLIGVPYFMMMRKLTVPERMPVLYKVFSGILNADLFLRASFPIKAQKGLRQDDLDAFWLRYYLESKEGFLTKNI